jgi:hypothetical protein
MNKCKKHPTYKAIRKPTADCSLCHKIWNDKKYPELKMTSGIFVWSNRSGEISACFFDEDIDLENYPPKQIAPDIGTFYDSLVKVVDYFAQRGFIPSEKISPLSSVSGWKEKTYIELQDFLDSHDQGWLKVIPQY